MSGELDDLTTKWKRRVQMYWTPLTRNVRPLIIMLKMRLGSDSNRELDEIMELDQNGETVKAAENFMRFLLNSEGLSNVEVSAQWSLFEEALRTVHPWLYDIVTGRCDPDLQNLQARLINFFALEIMTTVDPLHLYRVLVSKQLMEIIDIETLTRITEQKGPSNGAIYMVSRLHRSTNRNWYHEFLHALMSEGYEELVKEVDDIAYEKLRHKYDSENISASCEVEMSVSGEAHEAGAANYAGAPSPGSNPASSTSTSGQGAVLLDRSNTLPEAEHLSSREESDDDNERFRSCSPDMTSMTPVVDNDKDDAEMTLLKARASQNNSTASVNMAHKPAVEVANCEQSPPQNKMNSKNISMAEDTAGSPFDNSNVEMDSPRGEDERQGEPSEVLELRDYQQELASLALKGNNVIICAPTGSGKTPVALKIMQNHLAEQGQGVRKIVFLVNQVALAEQQYNQCVRFLAGYRCKKITGSASDTEKVPLNQLLRGADVMVVTAQILLDALDQKEIDGVCQFSLIIFDECHHTNQKHPFNCIMHHYMSVKYSNNDDTSLQLPQVVGLTASVGVGKAGRQEQAQNHILKLCAHLDASYICTVKSNVEQLAQYSNDPKYDQFLCNKRVQDDFQVKVEDIMKKIEENIDKSEHTKKACTNNSSDLASKLKPPRTRGTIQYVGWVSQLRKEVAQVRDPDARRFLESCRRMLDFYNSALIINEACDTEDAMKYLSKQIDITYDNIADHLVDIDTFLKELFDKNKPYLDTVSKQQANSNPKLIKLEELLVKAFKDEPTSRAIVFVKTRELADALKQWMWRRPQLRDLNPGKMVGAGPSVDRGGMTKNQQVDVMQYFRDGDHKVMVATSVAEEGLDIRRCNLVIRYEYVTNEIAMVQARGRARAENSQFVTLASSDKGIEAKEEINFIREIMMRDAIKELQEQMRTHFTEFRRHLIQIQKEEKSLRDIELAHRKGRQKRQGDVEFRCRKCDEYACMSSDIRKIENMHHVVIDLEFRDRHIERPNPKPESFGSIQMRGTLMCRQCSETWGRSILFKNTKFPVIKVEGFVLTDEFDRKDAPKRWKQTSFIVQSLEPEELEEYRKKAAAVGYTEDDD